MQLGLRTVVFTIDNALHECIRTESTYLRGRSHDRASIVAVFDQSGSIPLQKEARKEEPANQSL